MVRFQDQLPDVLSLLVSSLRSGSGLMINSSRAILYAGKGEDYATVARKVALETRDAINRWR